MAPDQRRGIEVEAGSEEGDRGRGWIGGGG